MRSTDSDSGNSGLSYRARVGMVMNGHANLCENHCWLLAECPLCELERALSQRDVSNQRIEELETLLPKAYNEGVGEGMREMNNFHGAKDWEDTVSFSKMRKATGQL